MKGRASWVFLAMFLAGIIGSVAAHGPGSCPAAREKCLQALENGQRCDPLPIPAESLPQPIREVGYNVLKVARNVFAVNDGSYFAMFVWTKRRLVLVDVPESFIRRDEVGTPIGTFLSDAVTEVVGAQTFEKIDLVYSHSHFDHIGGATVLVTSLRKAYPEAELEIYGSEGSTRLLTTAVSGRAPLPTRIITDKIVIRLTKGRVMELHPVVAGHIDGDMLVFFPRPTARGRGIVFTVDVFFPGWVPFQSFGLATDLHSYLAFHDQVLKLDFDVLIAGHLTRIGTKKDVLLNKWFTKDVLAAGQEALTEFSTRTDLDFPPVGDPTSPFFGNLWEIIAFSNAAQQDRCAAAVLKKWGCRLAGAEVFMRSLCDAAIFFIRLDQ